MKRARPIHNQARQGTAQYLLLRFRQLDVLDDDAAALVVVASFLEARRKRRNEARELGGLAALERVMAQVVAKEVLR